MIAKWISMKYQKLDVIDDDLQYRIFLICTIIIYATAVVLDMILIIPEFIYCLFKTLLIILKGTKHDVEQNTIK